MKTIPMCSFGGQRTGSLYIECSYKMFTECRGLRVIKICVLDCVCLTDYN